jgi:hypothetical protein
MKYSRLLRRFSNSMSHFILDPELPSNCTSLAVAKKLALQLLESNIGDVEFLNVLEHVHDLSIGSGSRPAI